MYVSYKISLNEDKSNDQLLSFSTIKFLTKIVKEIKNLRFFFFKVIEVSFFKSLKKTSQKFEIYGKGVPTLRR